MIDKSESVNRANVWWILGADHLTFEGLWVISEKKYPADLFRGKKTWKDLPGKYNILHSKKKIAHDVYNAEKNLTPLYVNSRGLGKTLTQTKSPISPTPKTSNGQPHTGWGKKRI